MRDSNFIAEYYGIVTLLCFRYMCDIGHAHIHADRTYSFCRFAVYKYMCFGIAQ